MNYDYINNYSEDEFEDIQAHYDGKAEYDNGLIFLSLTPSIHKLIDGAYQIVNVYKNNDEYESVVFPDLKINLRDIFE